MCRWTKKNPQWMAATCKGIYIESNCSKSDLFKPESPGRFSIFHIQESFLRSAPKRNKQLHHSTGDKIDRISPTKSYIYFPFWCKFTNISSCGAQIIKFKKSIEPWTKPVEIHQPKGTFTFLFDVNLPTNLHRIFKTSLLHLQLIVLR